MNPEELPENPLSLFRAWLDEARNTSGLENPNAMALATVDESHRPSVRMVLLKGLTEEGLAFYTNYESRKGRELEKNPAVAATFFWDSLRRQVRFYGRAEKISSEDSQPYFQSRPRGSQLAAWASPQSREIDETDLENRVGEIEEKFSKLNEIPIPPHWGGYLIRPDRIEFWQQGPNRLHDRCEYTLHGDHWRKRRLAP